MTAETIDLWLKIISSVLSISALIFAVYATRKKAINDRLDVGSKRMDAHDLAIQALQNQVGAMPGKDEMHQLQLALSGMSGELGKMSVQIEANGEVMARVNTVLQRHEDHLLKTGGN